MQMDVAVPVPVNMPTTIAPSIKSAQEPSDISLPAIINDPGIEVPVTNVPTRTASITAAPVNPSSTLTRTDASQYSDRLRLKPANGGRKSAELAAK